MKGIERIFIFTVIAILFVFSPIGLANTFKINNDFQNQSVVVNFELVILINDGNYRRMEIAQYLRNALAPLGIDVEVLSVPFSTFTNYLLRLEGHWDIAIVGFSGGSRISPNFQERYSCNGFYGNNMLELCHQDWHEALIESSTSQGNPLTQSLIDEYIANMDFEFNTTKKKEMVNSFQELYMNQLLYDYPTIARQGLYGIWAGFENYDPMEKVFGFIGSAFKGGYWNYADYPTLIERQYNSDAISLPISEIVGVPSLLATSSTLETRLIEDLFPTLIYIDPQNNPHPNVAYRYERSDWIDAPDLDSCTEPVIRDCIPAEEENYDKTISFGRITYYLPTEVNESWLPRYWMDPSTGLETEYQITPSDFALKMNLMMSKSHIQVNGMAAFDQVWKIDADDELGTLDIYVYKPNQEDIYFGLQQAIPSHLLGGALTTQDNIETYATHLFPPNNAEELVDPRTLDLNDILKTIEFKNFTNNPLQGGPYYIDFNNILMFDLANNFTKKANPHYWFPTEHLDSFGEFYSGQEDNNKGHYFNYNNGNRVTSLTINEIIFNIIANNEIVNNFYSGVIDYNVPFHDDVHNQIEDERFSVHNYDPLSSAELLIFNLLNDNLAKYDVRRAIAHTINKEALINHLNDPYLVSQDSPVYMFYQNSGWYNDEWKISYDTNKAAQLLIDNGYNVTSYTTSEETADDGTTEVDTTDDGTTNVDTTDDETTDVDTDKETTIEETDKGTSRTLSTNTTIETNHSDNPTTMPVNPLPLNESTLMPTIIGTMILFKIKRRSITGQE
jgi:hypothetical protein